MMWRAVLGACAMLLAAGGASGQAKPPAPLGGNVDLGFVQSSGNTSVATFSLGQKLTWRVGDRLTVKQQLRSIYGEANKKVNANLLAFTAGFDWRLHSGFGFTFGGGFDRNRFAGIARRSEQSVGFALRFMTLARDSVRFDAGSVWTQQENTAGKQRDFISVRAAFVYKRPLATGAYLQQSVEALPNMDTHEDWRVNTETSLVAPLSKKLGLKLAYVVRYDNLPEVSFNTTDKILTAGLQVTY